MKRILLFMVMAMLLTGTAMAADNLLGLSQVGPNVYAKNLFGFQAKTVSDNSTTQYIQNAGFVQLDNNASSLTVDFLDLDTGQFVIVTQTDNGTAKHTVSLPPGMSFSANTDANASVVATDATFNAEGETLIFMVVSPELAAIIENVGSVGME